MQSQCCQLGPLCRKDASPGMAHLNRPRCFTVTCAMLRTRHKAETSHLLVAMVGCISHPLAVFLSLPDVIPHGISHAGFHLHHTAGPDTMEYTWQAEPRQCSEGVGHEPARERCSRCCQHKHHCGPGRSWSLSVNSSQGMTWLTLMKITSKGSTESPSLNSCCNYGRQQLWTNAPPCTHSGPHTPTEDVYLNWVHVCIAGSRSAIPPVESLQHRGRCAAAISLIAGGMPL